MAESENERLFRISREVYREGGEAEAKLAAKCNWEHMSRMAAIQEWGDPREWSDA